METVRVSGGRSYVDIEYNGQIARFDGDVCLDGFAATVSSMRWVRHIGPMCDEEKQEIMNATYKYSEKNKKCRIYFYDDNGNEVKFG